MRNVKKYIIEQPLNTMLILLMLSFGINVVKLSNGNVLLAIIYLICVSFCLVFLFIENFKLRMFFLTSAFLLYYVVSFWYPENIISVTEIFPLLATFVAVVLRKFWPSILINSTLIIYVILGCLYHDINPNVMYTVQKAIFVLIISYVFSFANYLKQDNTILADIAFIDGLTKLPNRLFLVKELTQLIKENTPFTLLQININQFHFTNENFGYHIGDQLLVQFSKQLSSYLDNETFLCRYNGDEFILICKNSTTSDQTKHHAKKIKNALSHLYTIEDIPLYITFRMGGVVFPHDGTTIEHLLTNLSLAINEAKYAETENVYFFNLKLKQKQERKQIIERDLNEAIYNKEFQLYFQPQINKHSNKVEGAEVLIRWFHPTLGFVSPLEFIPSLEASKQIILVGEYIIESSIKHLIEIQKKYPTFHISINISPIQFQSITFLPFTEMMLQKYNICPHTIIYEITEQHAVKNLQTVIKNMNVLRNLGIRISLDDFGTGYSSLSYLQQIPLDEIKVAQEFIRNKKDEESEPFINMITTIAKELHLSIVIEGVETEQHLQLLRSKEIDYFQGYYFSKPIPYEEFILFIDKYNQ